MDLLKGPEVYEFGQKLKDGNVGCCLSLCENNVSLVVKKEQTAESSVLGVGVCCTIRK